MSRTVAMKPREPQNNTPRQPGVAILPPRGERTEIRPAVAAGKPAVQFALELATFAAAINKNPSKLLGALSGELAEHAQQRCEELRVMTSADRRARVAQTFAPPNDAVRRIRAVLVEAGPLLQAEIFTQLPPWMRVDVSDLVRNPSKSQASPLLTRLAARLIRESTR